MKITNLEGDVALWRAQAERGEASKQKLEYELAVLKKALAREKESARSKGHEMKIKLQQHEGIQALFCHRHKINEHIYYLVMCTKAIVTKW